MIDCYDFSLPKRLMSLTGATTIRYIAAFRIEPLCRSIGIKKADSDSCFVGTRGNQLLGFIHQARCEALPPESWKYLKVVNEGNIISAK